MELVEDPIAAGVAKGPHSFDLGTIGKIKIPMIKYKIRPGVRSKEGNMIVKRIKTVENWDLRNHSEVRNR